MYHPRAPPSPEGMYRDRCEPLVMNGAQEEVGEPPRATNVEVNAFYIFFFFFFFFFFSFMNTSTQEDGKKKKKKKKKW